MKNLIFAITLILSINVCAQNGFENTNVFVRVYDLQGKKINKGKILSISETSLQLNRKGEIPVGSIGLIKMRRSIGHNILVGASIGATITGLLVAVLGDNGDVGAVGLIAIATVGGAASGALDGIDFLSKKPKSYEINGDKVKWKEFKEMIIK